MATGPGFEGRAEVISPTLGKRFQVEERASPPRRGHTSQIQLITRRMGGLEKKE